jgi:hypothetical protein
MKLRNLVTPTLMIGMLTTAGVTVAQNYGPPPPAAGYQHGEWETAPKEFRDAQRRGYQDGVAGARKDFDNHRRPDVNNRDEYRKPPVAGPDQNDYRDGFQRGYGVAVQHMYGTPR